MADPEVTCTIDLVHTCHANKLFAELVKDIPDFDATKIQDLLDMDSIYDASAFSPLVPLTIESLTTRTVGGTGAFDALMESISVHLKEEYSNNRISGAEYVRAYIALTESAMGNSVQFLLQKDRAYWDSVNAQVQAMQSQVLLAQAKVATITSLAQLETQKAQYAVTKMSLDKINLEVSEILPLQIEKATFETNKILPKQDELMKAQVEKERAATSDTGLTWTTNATTGKDTATANSTPTGGVIGLQKDLYVQQERSYKQDTINSTMQHLYSTWAAGITNGLDVTVPTAVSTNFNTNVGKQLAALSSNTDNVFSNTP